MANRWKYGQLLISNQPVELIHALSEQSEIIPAGNKVVIGFDGLAHHLKNGYIQPLSEDAEVAGFSSVGVVEALYLFMRNQLPLDEMLENYELEPKDLTDVMYEALEEIGLYR